MEGYLERYLHYISIKLSHRKMSLIYYYVSIVKSVSTALIPASNIIASFRGLFLVSRYDLTVTYNVSFDKL